MDIKEIKKKKVGDLHKLLADSREKLRDLRFKDASKQLKNVREIRVIRKIIAQVLSMLNNKIENSKPEAEIAAEVKVVEEVKEETKK